MNTKAIDKLGPIAAARKSSLLSQEDMAARIGVSVPTMVEYEKHPENINLGTLGRIYHNVGVDGKAIIERHLDEIFLH